MRYETVGTATSVAPDRGPEVPREANRGEALVNELHDVIGALESRLINVLRPSPPKDASGGESPVSVLSAQLAVQLSCSNDGLVAARGRVSDLIDRLEV